MLGEAPLRLVVGSPEIMTAQLTHLRKSPTTVLVLPFSAGAYPLRGSFALLDFDDEDDPSVAYIDGPPAARYFDQPAERAEYEFVWNVLLDKAIPAEEWHE